MDIIALSHCCPPCVQQLWVADPPGGWWPLLCHCNLQVRPSSFTELARVLWNSRFSGQSLLWPTLVHSPRRCCCLSDNLQRATGQCLRDIWPQQQQQRRGRLFSRSVTTERRFSRRAGCSRSPCRPLQPPPSVASRGWPGEHQHNSPLGALPPSREPCNGQSVTNKLTLVVNT